MESSSFLVTQNVFCVHHPDIIAQHCHERDLSKHLGLFVDSIGDGVIGFAAIYGSKGRMTILALSSRTRALVVTLFSQGERKPKSKAKTKTKTSDPLHSLLCDSGVMKVTFCMDKLSAALFSDHGMRIANGKDLLSLSTKDSRISLAALMAILGNETTVVKKAVIDLFFNEGSHKEKLKVLALQAWVAFSASLLPNTLPRLKERPSISTVEMNQQVRPEYDIMIISSLGLILIVSTFSDSYCHLKDNS